MANDSVGTTVILIRHAERNNSPTADPGPHLNAAGRARAQSLIHVFGKSSIEAIYTSHFTRSKETAQPLAAHLNNLATTQMDEALEIKNDILANHQGKTVVVIGHSDTVPDLINLLDGGSMPVINDSEFDNLFIVTVLGSSKASVTGLKYGEPS